MAEELVHLVEELAEEYLIPAVDNMEEVRDEGDGGDGEYQAEEVSVENVLSLDWNAVDTVPESFDADYQCCSLQS